MAQINGGPDLANVYMTRLSSGERRCEKPSDVALLFSLFGSALSCGQLFALSLFRCFCVVICFPGEWLRWILIRSGGEICGSPVSLARIHVDAL